MIKEKDRLYFGEYTQVLEEKEEWLFNSLENILNDVSADPEQRPSEHILSRIKSPESICEKLKKRKEKTDVEQALKSLNDIIGVRIVVHFYGDVYEILQKIKSTELWKVVEVKDYISSPKKNGYRSLHVILAIPFDINEFTSLNVEIQIRTIAMDCWASLEHQLKYKKSIKESELIVMELSKCAAEMASVDLTMQTIREMIQKG